MGLENIIKKHLQQIAESHDGKPENYMFFGNLIQMHRQCQMLLDKDKNMLDNILKEHDWAQDHIAEAKSLLDQVFDFLMNEMKKGGTKNMTIGFSPELMNEIKDIQEGKNKPTNPKLWAQCLAWARARYKVCPSAYCNGAAAKRYKSKGGGWRKTKK